MKPLATLVLILSPLYVFSFQTSQKPNILFQGLKAKSRLESNYVASLESQVLASLVSCKRINIITRDSTYWKSVRQELAIKDLIDEKTALRLGELSGASHYLEGVLIRYMTDRKTEPKSDGTVLMTFNITVEASMSLINLNSGRQETSFSIQKSVWSKDPGESFATCLAQVAEEVKTKIIHYFPITTTVSGVKADTREITMSSNANDGVLLQSVYSLSTDKNVVVRVTEVGRESSTARVTSGDILKLQPGAVLNESFDNTKNAVRVVSVTKDLAYIDGGENLKIKKGDLFVVTKRKLIADGPSPIYEESYPSAVVVTDVKPDYAKARIIKGFSGIQKDTELVSNDERSFIRKHYVFGGYKIGLTPNIKANQDNGVVRVSNDVGDFQVPTSYNDNYKNIRSVRIITLGFGTHNISNQLSWSFNADIYNIGDGAMKNWIGRLDVTHESLIKENLFYLFYGAGAGYGTLKQRLPNFVLETISDGKSSAAKSSNFNATIKGGARLYIWRFGLSVTASYDFMKYKLWRYSAGKDSDVTAPYEIMPYPLVNLSGLYVGGTLSYNFTSTE